MFQLVLAAGRLLLGLGEGHFLGLLKVRPRSGRGLLVLRMLVVGYLVRVPRGKKPVGFFYVLDIFQHLAVLLVQMVVVLYFLHLYLRLLCPDLLSAAAELERLLHLLDGSAEELEGRLLMRALCLGALREIQINHFLLLVVLKRIGPLQKLVAHLRAKGCLPKLLVRGLVARFGWILVRVFRVLCCWVPCVDQLPVRQGRVAALLVLVVRVLGLQLVELLGRVAQLPVRICLRHLDVV